MTEEILIKSSEEQITGAIIEQIVRTRLEDLRIALELQDLNLDQAIEYIEACKRFIYDDIINRGLGRGGENGMHGFIAEGLEVFTGNARQVVQGKEARFFLDNDNGVADFHIGDLAYQSKFSMRYLSIDAVVDHARKYPEFVRDGGRYSIPSDFYKRICELRGIPESEIGSLTLVERNLWKKIQGLEDEGIEIGRNLEPSAFKFLDARREHVDETLRHEEIKIRKKDQEIRDCIEAAHGPSFGEAARAMGLGALLEAGVGIGLGAYRKIQTGKKIRDFDLEDWRDLGVVSTVEGVKGGIRGGAVYVLVNAVGLPGAAATAAVTATYGIIGQAARLREGKISPTEFCTASEVLCLESAISAMSSICGQAAIPVPVIGALVGNAAGMLAYQIAKGNLNEYEQGLVSRYSAEIYAAVAKYDEESLELIETYQHGIKANLEFVKAAYGPNKQEAILAAAEGALYAGAKEEMVPRSREEAMRIFEVGRK